MVLFFCSCFHAEQSLPQSHISLRWNKMFSTNTALRRDPYNLLPPSTSSTSNMMLQSPFFPLKSKSPFFSSPRRVSYGSLPFMAFCLPLFPALWTIQGLVVLWPACPIWAVDLCICFRISLALLVVTLTDPLFSWSLILVEDLVYF